MPSFITFAPIINEIFQFKNISLKITIYEFSFSAYCDKSVNKERGNEGMKDRNAGRGPGNETWERGTRNPMASSK